MSTSILMGGLGNQLFQFAAGYAHAKEHEEPLCVDTGFIDILPSHGGYRLDKLLLVKNIHIKKSSHWVKIFIYRLYMKWPRVCGFFISDVIYDGLINPKDLRQNKSSNATLLGYWQSDDHFFNYASFLKSNIIPISVSESANLTKVAMEECLSVSLHVRRGDYINNPDAISVHGVCSVYYYKQAISTIKYALHEPHFFVFTNDPSWVKQEFGELFEGVKMTLVEGNTQEEDLWLMSHAKHQIIANSSFSWWGAWLAKHDQQMVIAPTPWYDKSPKYSADPSLPEWIRLPK